MSGSRIPLQDEYCHKTESESKWCAGFSVQTSGRALQPAIYLQTPWSCVCPLLKLDLPRRGWSFLSYGGSPGRPALSAYFAERNGAFCMDTLSRRYNPFTARPLLHLWFSCDWRMVIAAGRTLTPWLATASAWYEPHRENVEWGEKTMQETWLVLPPRNSDELWALVSDAWDEVAASTRYIRSMTRRMKSEVEAERFWNSY